ncbi:MAG TPA: hypothetical protein VLH56_10175 [Dissulfurispiraceae bacterium]|nr:hypothetical protein [Dissulfurispiraceae bacterium]
MTPKKLQATMEQITHLKTVIDQSAPAVAELMRSLRELNEKMEQAGNALIEVLKPLQAPLGAQIRFRPGDEIRDAVQQINDIRRDAQEKAC